MRTREHAQVARSNPLFMPMAAAPHHHSRSTSGAAAGGPGGGGALLRPSLNLFTALKAQQGGYASASGAARRAVNGEPSR